MVFPVAEEIALTATLPQRNKLKASLILGRANDGIPLSVPDHEVDQADVLQ
jgi:hypothetical protein